MAEREEVKENNYSGHGLPNNGVDVLSDHGYADDCAKDLGPIHYPGSFKSKKEKTGARTPDTDLSQSSSEAQIKKRYRDMSRVYHPDKAVIDESKNQTAEGINDYWVEVSKAFKALTDEEIRNNYIQYGHPDGKQSFSIGIALPKFIVTDGNGKYVLLVYGVLLGVLLPYVVGKWWYGTQRMTKENVLLASAGNLFREYKEDLADGDVVNALSCGEEYKDILSGNKMDSGLGKIEKSIAGGNGTNTSVSGLTPKDQEKLQSYEGARRKASALVWAYLGRIRLDGSSLDGGLCYSYYLADARPLIIRRKVRGCTPRFEAERGFNSDHSRVWERPTTSLHLPHFTTPHSSRSSECIAPPPAPPCYSRSRPKDRSSVIKEKFERPGLHVNA